MARDIKDKTKGPDLRFPGFEGEWVEKRLGEVASFSKGKGISKADIIENGKIKCIRYGELYTTYTEVINKVYSSTDLDVHSLVLSEKNDVIIPASGETQIDIATASCVLRSGIALGGDLNIIKTNYNGIFLSYYLNNKKKREIANLAQGISVVHLYSNQLSSLNIKFPPFDEQQKIAAFLSLVDERIARSMETIDKHQTSSRNLKAKIFKQEIRFKNEDGNEFPEWEMKKLREICSIGSGKDYKHLASGTIPVFGTGGLMTYVDSFLYDGETVCIGRKGTIDKPMYYNGKIWTVDTLFYTHSFISTIPKYLLYLFQNINWKEYNEASGVPSLSKTTIEKIEVFLPSKKEQIKIANFLTSIDNKIDLETSILNRLKLQKQYLLKHLFV